MLTFPRLSCEIAAWMMKVLSSSLVSQDAEDSEEDSGETLKRALRAQRQRRRRKVHPLWLFSVDHQSFLFDTKWLAPLFVFLLVDWGIFSQGVSTWWWRCRGGFCCSAPTCKRGTSWEDGGFKASIWFSQRFVAFSKSSNFFNNILWRIGVLICTLTRVLACIST